MQPNNVPARPWLHRRKDGGGGHWLVAYRKAEEQSHSHMHRRIKDTWKKHENMAVADAPRAHTLNGPFLLRSHCVDKPSELCSVHISEQELDSVKPEDLKMFHNVAYVDASVNLLSLGSFSSFVSLRELNLSVNGIHIMTFDASDFPHLQVLDLSYNSVSADSVVSISRLPRVKVLHLTGNQLHHLPPDLGSTQLPADEEDSQFKTLEVLMLDDNKLSSGVFSSLRNLKRLKYLNLKGNRISEIPYVPLTVSLEPASLSEREPGEDEPVSAASAENTLFKADHTEPDPNKDGSVRRVSQENLEELCRGSSLPLPQLQFLDLSVNRIAEEEALMAAAFFPMLREIDIHSNPLTTHRSGDPPLLTHYLQEGLGITIKRKETQEAVKTQLKVSSDPKWKLGERIPKVTRKHLLETVKKTPACEGNDIGDGTFTENSENFFVTQAAGVSKFDEKATAENEDPAAATPEKSQPHDLMLTEAKPNPGVVEPVGIQTAVRMLEHALKTLSVYGDSKPKCDSIQMPHGEKETRTKDLPPLKAAKPPAERVDEMLREIRGSTTIRELALSDAVRGTRANKQEHKEVLSLLRDVKTKYKMLHKTSIERVAGVGSDRNADIHEATPPAGQTL